MKLLLDTHALLWWVTADGRLPEATLNRIADEATDVCVSAATAWEIATKHRLGKLSQAAELVTGFDALVLADGFQHLPISPRHALHAGSYPQAHRDPFDRMLAAQSELDGLALVTCDSAFEAFAVDTVWG